MRIIQSLVGFMLRIALAALVVLGILYYVTATEAGLQFVWSIVKNELPAEVQVGSVHGNLISHLSVADISYQNQTANVAVKSIDLRWDALKLLRRKFVIHDVDVDGVNVSVQTDQASSGTSSFSSKDILRWLRLVRLEHASIHDAKVNIGDAHILVNGNLDDAWHMQWSVNVPRMDQLVSDIHGKLMTTGTIRGKRMQPEIDATVMLDQFKTEYFSIRSVSGGIKTELNEYLADRGSLKVKGLNIEGFLVPDFTLNTMGRLHDGKYQLQAAAVLSPVNIVNASLILPKITEVVSINQPFHATAVVNVKDFSQFNTLFIDVPQVRQFAGRVTGSFRGDGELLHPVFDGGLQAENGSVFIPVVSMRLSDIKLQTHYHTGQQVSLRGTFTAGTGRASLEGTYDLESPSLPLVLRVRGDNVRIYDTKEYKINISPDILLSYRDNDLDLGGKILVPYAEIKPVDFRSTATLPGDVVIVNNKTAANMEVPTNVSLQVQLLLGDDVKLQYRDLKTRLLGGINIFGKPGQPLTATGEFRINDGSYRAYGRNLNIQQGRLIYAGNLLTNPGISLRASQSIKTVAVSGSSQFESSGSSSVYTGSGLLTVGIAVSGTIEKPRITLFSNDSDLSQGDILSYLLFGYPQSQASGASGFALLNVASQMYGGNTENVNPVENLQSKLGLNELSVGNTEYFDPSANTTDNPASVKSATTVNLGRDLGHHLSLHYSIGLFQQVQVFSLRYQINRHLAIQTETSTLENGGDLLYTLESAH